MIAAFTNCGIALSKFDVSFNEIDSLYKLSLSDILRSVRELDISGNDLGSDCGTLLRKALSNSTRLSHFCSSSVLSNPINISTTGMFVPLDLSEVVKKNAACLCKLEISNNRMTGNTLEALGLALKHCDVLQELDISKNRYTISALKIFAESLRSLTNLQVLIFGFNNIGSNGAKVLASGLIHCSNLRQLSVNNNNIDDSGIDAIGDVITHCSKLSMLSLAGNKLSSKGAELLAEALKESRRFQELDISDNNIIVGGSETVSICLESNIHFDESIADDFNASTSSGEKALSNALDQCFDLRSISVSCATAHLGCLNFFFGCLKNCSNLQTLHLGGSVDTTLLLEGLRHCSNLWELRIRSSIKSSDVITLSDVLSEHCRKIRILDIGCSQAGSPAVNSLSMAMKHCSNLQELYLPDMIPHNSELTADADFFLSLPCCTKLHALDVSSNWLEDRHLEALCSSLVHCKMLLHLHLRNNVIGSDGIKALATVLMNCPMLQTLDLSGSNLGHHGAVALANVLQNGNSSLSTLSVSDCEIDADGAAALIKAIQYCPSLSSFDISNNSLDENTCHDNPETPEHCTF